MNDMFNDNFIVGVNLPWLDGQYDHDFGTNQIRSNDLPSKQLISTYMYSQSHLEKYLKDISEMGISVVRLWLFERFEGLAFSPTGHVVGPTTDFFMNLRDACNIAQQFNIKFYFCLMDSWGITSPDLKKDQQQHYANMMNGLITTPDKRESFLQAAIDVLNDDVIKQCTWAVDVLNEPEGLEREKILQDRHIDTEISLQHLIEYINDASRKIKMRTGHNVSCGFQTYQTIIKIKDQIKDNMDFFDFHKYDDEGKLPDVKELQLEKPCIIGECSQSSHSRDDDIQKTAIKNFLYNSKKQGYSGCMIWEYGYFNQSENTSHSIINSDGRHRPVVEEIRKFTNQR